MSLAWHCDRDDCDTWQRIHDDAEDMPHGWLVVESRGLVEHFCCIDHLLVHHAKFEPLEEM